MEFWPSHWTDAELDDAILQLCQEFPDVRMAACSRAVEYCRRTTPRGTPESLLASMRDVLRRDIGFQPASRVHTGWRPVARPPTGSSSRRSS